MDPDRRIFACPSDAFYVYGKITYIIYKQFPDHQQQNGQCHPKTIRTAIQCSGTALDGHSIFRIHGKTFRTYGKTCPVVTHKHRTQKKITLPKTAEANVRYKKTKFPEPINRENEMDHRKNFPFDTFREFEKEFGRMIRNMSSHRLFPFQNNHLMPATDIYETSEEIIIYMEAPGINPDDISISANPTSITISGFRRKPVFNDTICIHQLEADEGHFERTVLLSNTIDPAATSSSCKNGCLLIRMPKQKNSTHKITIEESGS